MILIISLFRRNVCIESDVNALKQSKMLNPHALKQSNLEIQAAKIHHTIQDLQARIDKLKVKLASEIKVFVELI